MGLDQWLYAKTSKRELNNHTGVCSGLFGMVPAASDGMVEIGYWRKAYDQEDLIYQVVKGKFNDQGNLFITKEEVDKILELAIHILTTHRFNPEDGDDMTRGDPVFGSDSYTWQSKRKWADTIRFFTEAKQILEEDPEAEIYYHRWA
jgi:hypothetical protein